MRFPIRVAAAALLALPSIGAAPPSPARIVTGNGIVSGSVGGVPVRLRIDPAAVSTPLVSAEVARRAGLKPSLFEFEYAIGTVKIGFDSAVTRFDSGTGPEKRRVAWSSRTWAPGLDGVVGPGMLPEETIRFALRPRQAGEVSSALPLVGQGGLGSQWGERFAAVPLGQRTLKVQFDPHHELSIATAQAGALIAAHHGGHFTGESRSVEIAFGVERPVRMMELARPLEIGSLTITRLGVRTADFGSAAGIPEKNADPNEIVVRAGGKAKAAYDQLKLGGDTLAACSSITFERKAKKVRLDCRPVG